MNVETYTTAKEKYANISEIYTRGYDLVKCGSTCANKIQDFLSDAHTVIKEVDFNDAHLPSLEGGLTSVRFMLNYMHPIMYKVYQDASGDQEKDTKDESDVTHHALTEEKSAQEKYLNISEVYARGYELVKCGSTCANKIESFFSDAQKAIRAVDPNAQSLSFDEGATVREALSDMYPIMYKAYQDALGDQTRDSSAQENADIPHDSHASSLSETIEITEDSQPSGLVQELYTFF